MKTTTLFALIIALTALTTSGCFRNDRRTGEFSVPALQSQECLNVLTGKLQAAEGVEHVEADYSAKTLKVTFNGLKLSLKNIEIIIAEAGFDVNERPALESAKAALPPSCH